MSVFITDFTTESDSSDESDASDTGSCDGFRVVRRRSHTLPEHLPIPPVDPTTSPLEGPSEDCSKSLSSICTDSSEDATSDPYLQQNTEAEMVPEVAKVTFIKMLIQYIYTCVRGGGQMVFVLSVCSTLFVSLSVGKFKL